MAISNGYLDNIINNKITCTMIDSSGNSSVILILYRYKDHGRKFIKYHGNDGTELDIPMSNVFSITPGNWK